MGKVRTACGGCGDVEVTASDITVRVCRDTGKGSYIFRCPKCTQPVAKYAKNRIVELLLACGGRLVTWSLPEEVWEKHDGPPINQSDVKLFYLLVLDDRLFWEDFDQANSSK